MGEIGLDTLFFRFFHLGWERTDANLYLTFILFFFKIFFVFYSLRTLEIFFVYGIILDR